MITHDLQKFRFAEAMDNLKSDAEFLFTGDYPMTEEKYATMEWATGVAENGTAILTTVNPHSELTWTKVNAEMTRLQTEYDSKVYARKRQGEYPATKDFMEAYTEKEIGGDSTKWDAYIINYNKVRTENPK